MIILDDNYNDIRYKKTNTIERGGKKTQCDNGEHLMNILENIQ